MTGDGESRGQPGLPAKWPIAHQPGINVCVKICV